MNITRRNAARLLAGGLAMGVSKGAVAGLFQHGVASGDPLQERVVLWTRVTPSSPVAAVQVDYIVSENTSMFPIVRQGTSFAVPERDYTVKVDVGGLTAGKTYYYQFRSQGQWSPMGRTKTLPIGRLDRLRVGVASCSNFPFGYFNAYRTMAMRQDLDFVLHLGDYIYEYANGQFGDGTAIGRIPAPNTELLTLQDYRTRHAQYKSDPDLQELHRQNPFIVVWDDHESANDAYKDGAQNHTPETEGDWEARKTAAKKAWFEWLPVRETPGSDRIYRRFIVGDLLDLIMLDTRLHGRDKQLKTDDLALGDPRRTLLGFDQEAWFYTQLSASQARGAQWRLVGQQVMVAQIINVTRRILNPDQWDGYTPARRRWLNHVQSNRISNMVVVTGDIHSSWGNDLSLDPFDESVYNPDTGKGSLGVEFVAPGITSPAITDQGLADTLEAILNVSHPHIKKVDLVRRGYTLIDIDRERVQGEWYHPDTLVAPSTTEIFGGAMLSLSGENKLTPVNTPSAPKPAPPPFAL